MRSALHSEMRVLITGASGFVGSSLCDYLAANRHQVVPLHHVSQSETARPAWNPSANWIDLRSAGKLDAVVHLAGENIAQRWTCGVKARIKNSRENGTRLLSETLAGLPEPPSVLVCASAIGFYGYRGEEIVDEQSDSGSGFLADVCRAWERAADPARQRGIRVVHLRLGMVLGAKGGALAKMLPVFRMGLGARLGSGGQYWSWISLEDLVRVIALALNDERLRGPVNAVAPAAVTNREFTAALAHVLHRPAFMSMPAFAVKLLFGQMGEEAMLASTRVRSARLTDIGFHFQHPELELALRHLLNREPKAFDMNMDRRNTQDSKKH